MRIVSRSVTETKNAAKRLARHLRASDIICLSGELGAGKTVFAKGLAHGLNIKEEEVTSPSFVLVRQYSGGRLPLNHLDLYRLGEERQMLDVGYEDYLYAGAVSVIEWPVRLGYLMPKEYLNVAIEMGKKAGMRAITFSAVGSRYEALLKEMALSLRGRLVPSEVEGSPKQS